MSISFSVIDVRSETPHLSFAWFHGFKTLAMKSRSDIRVNAYLHVKALMFIGTNPFCLQVVHRTVTRFARTSRDLENGVFNSGDLKYMILVTD